MIVCERLWSTCESGCADGLREGSDFGPKNSPGHTFIGAPAVSGYLKKVCATGRCKTFPPGETACLKLTGGDLRI